MAILKNIKFERHNRLAMVARTKLHEKPQEKRPQDLITQNYKIITSGPDIYFFAPMSFNFYITFE